MTSSQMKRFAIVASILSTSDAMSLLREGSINERALEALDCTGRRWHFTLAETIKCSNDMDYPLAWDNGDSYLGRTIFTTAADCCAVIEASGRSCEVIDECDVVAQDAMNVMKHTTTYKGQCGNKWHLDIEKPWGCSNSKDFPDDWWLEEAVDRMLHDTAESCCNEMFGSSDCDLFDECEEKVKTPCSEPTWYYDRDNHYCTNDGNYPVIWENPEVRDALLYKTKEDCCEKNPWQCTVHDFCNEWSEVTRD